MAAQVVTWQWHHQHLPLF